MPRRLPDRFLPHTVNEFRAAAFQRHRDALALVETGRRTAAIHLWGYSAEMILKAAIFSVWGYGPEEEISLEDIKAAKQLAAEVGLPWGGSLHYLAGWGELLVRYRATLPGTIYPNADFGIEVVARTRKLYQTWRESLRYHKNVAYAHEVRDIRNHVEWLLDRWEWL